MKPKPWNIFDLHPSIAFFFSHVIAEDGMAQAYLFRGPKGVGKRAFAAMLAAVVTCQNPQRLTWCGKCPSCEAYTQRTHQDILPLRLSPDQTTVSPDDVRVWQKSLYLAPLFSSRKVGLIEDLTAFSEGSLQSLLKTIEEPPAHVILFLVYDEGKYLPSTIISRCQQIFFSKIPSRVFQPFFERDEKLPLQVQYFFSERPYQYPFSWEQCMHFSSPLLEIFSETRTAPRVLMVRSLMKEIEKQKDEVVSLLDLWTFALRHKILALSGLITPDLFFSSPSSDVSVLTDKLTSLLELREQVMQRSGINTMLSVERFLFE